MDCSKIKVVKKDGTREDFNVQKVLSAISKSAERAMITFSRAERNFICEFVEEKAEEMDQELIPIAQMHNIVEGALEKVNPLVAKSHSNGEDGDERYRRNSLYFDSLFQGTQV